VTEDVADAPPGLPFAMPWVASIPSLEQMDKRMVMLAVDSARTVQSKAQLWRYIEEIGISPLLAALKKNFGEAPDKGSASASEGGEADREEAGGGGSGGGGGGGGIIGSAIGAGVGIGIGAVADAVIDSGVLRTEAVEAILHLMNVAMDLVREMWARCGCLCMCVCVCVCVDVCVKKCGCGCVYACGGPTIL
jgi:hypothetical protein